MRRRENATLKTSRHKTRRHRVPTLCHGSDVASALRPTALGRSGRRETFVAIYAITTAHEKAVRLCVVTA